MRPLSESQKTWLMCSRLPGSKINRSRTTSCLVCPMTKQSIKKRSKFANWKEIYRYCQLAIRQRLERKASTYQEAKKRGSGLLERFTLTNKFIWWMTLFRRWMRTLRKRFSKMFLSKNSVKRPGYLSLTQSTFYTLLIQSFWWSKGKLFLKVATMKWRTIST